MSTAVGPSMSRRPVPAAAFTLIELLVVIAIIAVLAALLMPALERARNAARTVVCQSNVRQFMLGMFNYTNDYAVVPPHNCYDTQGEVMPQLGVFKEEKYIGDYEILICPTSPTYLEFKWTGGNPYDRSDPLFGNFWNYAGKTVGPPGGMVGQNVPMGTYYYRAGAHQHPTATEPFSTAAGYALRLSQIRSAARYAAIWDWDLGRWGGMTTRPHAGNPGRMFGFFDGRAQFIPDDAIANVDEVTPWLTQRYIYHYEPGVTPWHGYGLTKGCFDTSCFPAQIAAIRRILAVP